MMINFSGVEAGQLSTDGEWKTQKFYLRNL